MTEKLLSFDHKKFVVGLALNLWCLSIALNIFYIYISLVLLQDNSD